MTWLIRALADRLALADFFPWPSEEAMIDAILAHPATGYATVASLRAQGGIGALQIAPVGHPTLHFSTPSGKVEFVSARAAALGLPALPVYTGPTATTSHLVLAQGRTLTHFHSFYDHGQALPSLAKRDAEPCVWISPVDAAARQIADGKEVRVLNERGVLQARAHVTRSRPSLDQATQHWHTGSMRKRVISSVSRTPKV
jgi:anaerobic selenocysteine-containing dehydrogenase